MLVGGGKAGSDYMLGCFLVDLTNSFASFGKRCRFIDGREYNQLYSLVVPYPVYVRI